MAFVLRIYENISTHMLDWTEKGRSIKFITSGNYLTFSSMAHIKDFKPSNILYSYEFQARNLSRDQKKKIEVIRLHLFLSISVQILFNSFETFLHNI